MRQLQEDFLRRVANILGPSSAAADALRDAETRRSKGESVEFFIEGSRLIVQGMLPGQRHDEEAQCPATP